MWSIVVSILLYSPDLSNLYGILYGSYAKSRGTVYIEYSTTERLYTSVWGTIY